MDLSMLTRRLSRRALTGPNAVYFLWRFVANGVRTARALTRQRMFPDTAAITAELRKQGIAVGPTEQFLTPEGLAALRQAEAPIQRDSRSDEVQAIVAGTAAGSEKKRFLVNLVSYRHGIAADDPMLRVALDPKLLEIVAGYLGLLPSLHSIAAWLNYPTPGEATSSQLWHRDPEDLKLVKVFIYLNDVGEQSGPFTYIPKTHPFGAKVRDARHLERHKRLPDHLVRRVFPASRWRVCTGPPHTMILADTVGYHRGGKPLVGQRILVTFTYTSGSPMTTRALWVRSVPSWASSGIQRFALARLVRTAPGPATAPDAAPGVPRQRHGA